MYDVRKDLHTVMDVVLLKASLFGRYSLGDARHPNTESASLIEEITQQQTKNIVSTLQDGEVYLVCIERFPTSYWIQYPIPYCKLQYFL